jgi:hypothetical protein
MNIPRFTAELSLYQTPFRYAAAGSYANPRAGLVSPADQQPFPPPEVYCRCHCSLYPYLDCRCRCFYL